MASDESVVEVGSASGGGHEIEDDDAALGLGLLGKLSSAAYLSGVRGIVLTHGKRVCGGQACAGALRR